MTIRRMTVQMSSSSSSPSSPPSTLTLPKHCSGNTVLMRKPGQDLLSLRMVSFWSLRSDSTKLCLACFGLRVWRYRPWYIQDDTSHGFWSTGVSGVCAGVLVDPVDSAHLVCSSTDTLVPCCVADPPRNRADSRVPSRHKSWCTIRRTETST